MGRGSRNIRDHSGNVWEVHEVLRYGIGRHPTVARTALVYFDSMRGEHLEALLEHGEIDALTEAEMIDLIDEIVAFENAQKG